jgi:hypothetical protein
LEDARDAGGDAEAPREAGERALGAVAIAVATRQ